MKIKSLLFSLLFPAFAFVLLTNCAGNKKEETAAKSLDVQAAEENASEPNAGSKEANVPQFQVDQAFQQQLGNVFTSYVSMKEAFVSSDAEKVKAEALSTSQVLSKVDMKLLSGAAHNDWMNYLGSMENAIKDIQATADIESQRQAFSSLSDNLYKSIKAFGLGGKEAFYEFCPMAFNNEGGYWLSDKQQIRNPYFGEMMLTCGEVKEKLR